MFSHLFLGVNDFDRSKVFYSALAEILGLELKFSNNERGLAGWQKSGEAHPTFVIGNPLDGKPATAGNGQMMAFLASNRTQVEQAHRAALELGGSSEGEPGLRPHYHEHYFGAYFRDPDGNKLCVCCHQPE